MFVILTYCNLFNMALDCNHLLLPVYRYTGEWYQQPTVGPKQVQALVAKCFLAQSKLHNVNMNCIYEKKDSGEKEGGGRFSLIGDKIHNHDKFGVVGTMEVDGSVAWKNGIGDPYAIWTKRGRMSEFIVISVCL